LVATGWTREEVRDAWGAAYVERFLWLDLTTAGSRPS
jgi:hypothetical protein